MREALRLSVHLKNTTATNYFLRQTCRSRTSTRGAAAVNGRSPAGSLGSCVSGRSAKTTRMHRNPFAPAARCMLSFQWPTVSGPRYRARNLLTAHKYSLTSRCPSFLTSLKPIYELKSFDHPVVHSLHLTNTIINNTHRPPTLFELFHFKFYTLISQNARLHCCCYRLRRRCGPRLRAIRLRSGVFVYPGVHPSRLYAGPELDSCLHSSGLYP
ncbi:hypothetical protein BU26DRAFT_310600 [Trematosphaeria pertusa]|uniref:Uncharacterized protein n=1 Tax=Trematosphaeria pertusa TaxID=390896 RepID=A0A6A6IHH4_9PLEO|nr:uncharacterized protein BU26DRAFT_310600 [Trematosphaeria pertusa]KAF2249020.1 hypothetical protein BU26DRAFT_310600 [Trematosphaeria pertusa]